MLHQGANSLPNASGHQDIKNKSDKRGTTRSWKLRYSAVQRSSLFTVNIPVANSRASPPNSTASSNTITVKVRANRKRTGQAAKSASRSDLAALHKLTSLTSPFRKWILTEGQLDCFLATLVKMDGKQIKKLENGQKRCSSEAFPQNRAYMAN